MYKSEISNAKWMAYAILANVGWVSFFVALSLCFIKTPEILESGAVLMLLVIDILGAELMLCGIVELMKEYIKKLSRVLSGKQLTQGFGALTLGGVLGAICSLLAVVIARCSGLRGACYFLALGAGSLLCGIFSGLILKEYRKI